MPIITAAARCLEETVKSGSIRKAAEILNLSASAVNRHILNLEAEYGIALLDRLPRGVVATEAGQLLVARLGEWRREFSETADKLNTLRGHQNLRIAVGLNECVATSILPEIIGQLRTRHPDVSLSVTVGGSDDLAAALVGGSLDVVVAFNLRRTTEFWSIASTVFPVGVVVPPDHPLADAVDLTLLDCARFPLIVTDESLTLRPLLDTLLAQNAAMPGFKISSNHIHFIKQAVRAGLGITLLTPLDVAQEIAEGTLRYVPLRQPSLVETLAIGVRDGREMPPAIQAFCTAMAEEMSRRR